jgi:Ca-activated chloride channel family protein
MDAGFRPVNPAVELGYPFVPENGVTAQGPKTVLDVPAPNVIAEIQQSWAYVKKQADVMLLIDVSGSMQSEGKLDQAKQAALAFIESMDTSNRVGLTIFSDRAREIVPLDKLETNLVNLRGSINSLQPEGGTELYLSSQQAIDAMSAVEDDRRIRAVVILSDGADTGDSGATLNDVTRAISASRESINPVIVIPVAYGSDADINALNSIARAAATRVQSGDPNNIQALLQLISSYF